MWSISSKVTRLNLNKSIKFVEAISDTKNTGLLSGGEVPIGP